MSRKITIHKPTHKFFAPSGTPAIAIGQLRGDRLYLNRLEHGRVIERTHAIGSCAYDLTGYGHGVARHASERTRDAMKAAWLYTFGPDVPMVEWCEIHKESK